MLHDRAILGYTDPINKHYTFWLIKILKLPAITNLVDT